MAQVTELVTLFKFSGSTKPLETFNTSMEDAIGLITTGATIFAAGAIALNAFVVSSLAGADAQGQLAATIGVTVEEIQKLGFAASVNGSSLEDMQSSLEGLNEKIGEAAIQGSEAFNRLGINIRFANGEVKKADTVLAEVGQRFKALNLSVAEQGRLLGELGINKNLAQTLRLTASEMKALKDEAEDFGIITTEQTKEIIEFNDSLTRVAFGMDSLRKIIAIGLGPQMTNISDDFIVFLKANKDLIANGIGKTFEVINAGLGSLFRVGGAILDLVDNTIGLKNAAILLTGAVLVLNRAMLANPVVLITTGIIALFLAVDDLIVAFQGGESIIADFFKNAFDIDIVDKLTSGIDILKDALKDLLIFFAPVLKGINTILEPLGKLGEAIGFENIFTNANAGLDNLVAGSTSNVSNSTSQAVTINITTSDPQAAGAAAAQSIKQEFDLVKSRNKRGNF